MSPKTPPKPAAPPAPRDALGAPGNAAISHRIGWHTIVGAAVLVVLAVLCYANAFAGDFLYDDFPYIVNNVQVQQPSFERIFFEPLSGRGELGLYRPLPTLTYAWQAAGRGAEAPTVPFHLLNVLLHAATAVAAWRFLLRFGAGTGAAWLAAALFAVHPCHVEAVDWIVGRAELMAALFGLCFLNVALREHRRPLDTTLAALLLAAAGLSKESAFTLPVMLFAIERVQRRPGGWRAAIARNAPFALVIVALLVLRYAAMGRIAPALGLAPFRDVSWWQRPLVSMQLLGEYLCRALLPLPSRLFYHEAEFAEPRALAIAGFVAWAAATWLMRRRVALCAAMIAFPLSLLTVLNLWPIQETFAERFLYLPSLFALLLPATALASWIARERATRGRIGASLAAPALTITLLGGITLFTHSIWDDALRLWRHNVAKSPDLPFVHYQYAFFLHDRAMFLRTDAQTPGALEEYEAALDCNERMLARGYNGMPADQLARTHVSIGSIWLSRLPPERRSAVRAKPALERAIELGERLEGLDPETGRALYQYSLLRHHGVGVSREVAERALRSALTLDLSEEMRQTIAQELERLLSEPATGG